jgi:hypothetical protein
MINRDVDDMEDIIDPLLMRKRSGKCIAQMLVRSGFGRVSSREAALEAVCDVLSNAEAFGKVPAASDILAAVRKVQ